MPSFSLIDLSHTVEDGLITYKGLLAAIICDYQSRKASRDHYDGGATFHIGKFEMIASTGTYLDSPVHRFADGFAISELAVTANVLTEVSIKVFPDLRCCRPRVLRTHGKS